MESEGERSVGSQGAPGQKRRRFVRSRSGSKASVASTEAPAAPRTTGQSRRTSHSGKDGGADAKRPLQHESGSSFSEAPTAHRGSRSKASRKESLSKRSSSSRASNKPAEANATATTKPFSDADVLSKSEPTKDHARGKSVSEKDIDNDLAFLEAATKASPSGQTDTREEPVPPTATATSTGTDTGRVPPGNAATSGKDGQATPPAPVPSFPAPRLSRRFSLRKGYYKDGDLESRPISAAGSLMHIGSRDDGRANESWVPWSPFFPLNVNFVSEITKEAQQCLFGVVVFLSALIVSLVVAGLVVLLYAKREASPLDCVTAECAAARDYLRQLLNTSEDACQDFYGYVCDSWLRRGPHNGSFRRDSFLASLVAINESLLRQLDHRGTPDHPVGSNAIRILSPLYRKCHIYVSNNTTSPSFQATLDAARALINWTTVRAAGDFRKLVTLLAQKSLLFGIHTILAVEMFTRNGHPILCFSRRSSLLQKLTTEGDRDELSAAIELIVNGRMEDFDTILAVDKLVEKSLLSTAKQGQNETEVFGMLEKLLRDLVPGVSMADWIEAVNRLRTAHEYVVHPSDMGIGSGIPSVRQAFREINAKGGVSIATVYLAAHIDAEVLSMELSKRRAAADDKTTAQFCLEMARNCLGHLWPSLLSQHLEIGKSAHFVQDIYRKLKRAAHELDLFTWLTDVNRGTAEANLEKLALRIASGHIWVKGMNVTGGLDEADYAFLLAGLDEPGGRAGFVELYLNVAHRYHELRIRKPPILDYRVLLTLEERSELAYSPLLHALVVPTTHQREPYLYATTRVPTYFNYGTLGALIATGIADAIAPTAALLMNKVEQVDEISLAGHTWWTKRALSRYNASAACLQSLHTRLRLRRPAGQKLELQWRAMFLHAMGLRLAYNGLLASFGRQSDTEEFRKLWPQAQAEFFARFCLLSCDADKLSDPVLTPRARCLLPLHNMHEFGAVFDCTAREDFITDHCPL